MRRSARLREFPVHSSVFTKVSTEILPPQNPPDRETQISRHLAVQLKFVFLVEFEFVPRNLSFSIWISGMYQFQWHLSIAQQHTVAF